MVSLIGLFAFLGFGRYALTAGSTPGFQWPDLIFSFFSIYGLVLVLFSQMDAKSRFQNYKQVKDLLYENGFRKRIINLFCMSRCQRDAVRVAAKDLGLIKQLDQHYKNLGYHWFHVIPDFTIARPQLFFTRRYWQKTLFTRTYQSKYFLW